jgi:hypothetical protein
MGILRAIPLFMALSCSAQVSWFDALMGYQAPAATGGGGGTTNWPGWITVAAVSSTNTTSNAGTYLATPAFSVKSNVLYLAGIVHSKASSPNTSIFTNGLSYQWTLVGRQSFNTTATPLEMLEIFSFITNVDMPDDRPTAYFTANQTGCSIGILSVSNVDCFTPVVQNAFGVGAQSANPNVTLSALNASGSNAVVAFAGNYTNTANFWQASGSRTEDYDLVYSTPATGFWAGHETNTVDNTVNITAAAGNWAIGAVEVGWLGTAKPAIRLAPVAQSVLTNTTATFTVCAIGGPILSYQWTWGGTNIGANSTAVSITPTDVSQTGLNVQCNVSNSFGYAESSAAALTVSDGSGPALVRSSYTNKTDGSTMVFVLTGVPAGAFIAVSEADENASGNGSVSDNVSGAWGAAVTASAANSGNACIWTNICAGGGSLNVSVVKGGSYGHESAAVYVFTNAAWGAKASATAQAVGVTSITASKAASTLVAITSDWSAKTGTAVYTNTPVTLLLDDDQSGVSAYRGYHLCKTNAASGAQFMGVASPTSMAAGVCVLEVKAP